MPKVITIRPSSVEVFTTSRIDCRKLFPSDSTATAPLQAPERGAALAASDAPVDNDRLANLCGPLDANLRQIEEAFDVQIARRGNRLSYRGARPAVRSAKMAIEHFIALASRALSIDDIQLGLVELKAAQQVPNPDPDDDSPVLRTRRADLQGRTPRQREYLRKILSYDITFGIGPAGTGKTYLAVACAVDAMERDTVQRIVLTRPAVEAGERLGFLPGDLAQKVDP